MATEKERETHVYLAKLAEQAERYDGMIPILISVLVSATSFARLKTLRYFFSNFDSLGFRMLLICYFLIRCFDLGHATLCSLRSFFFFNGSDMLLLEFFYVIFMLLPLFWSFLN